MNKIKCKAVQFFGQCHCLSEWETAPKLGAVVAFLGKMASGSIPAVSVVGADLRADDRILGFGVFLPVALVFWPIPVFFWPKPQNLGGFP